MRRYEWMYDEEAWESQMQEEKVEPSPEKQCRNCLHWIDRESLSCSWCGKSQEEGEGESRRLILDIGRLGG